MIVIGITGTLGAGKGTVVEYLKDKFNFSHYSVRGYLIDEINRRNMPVNRDSMVVVANDLRARHNPAFIIEELYHQAVRKNNNCIIESIRTTGEVEALRTKPHFHLLAVDAEPELRYQRIHARKSETDMISYEEFLQNEKREMTAHDPGKQNLSKCIELADYKLLNNSTVENFYKQIEQWLKQIGIYDRSE